MSNTTPTETNVEEVSEEMLELSPTEEKDNKKRAPRPRKEKPPKEPRVKTWADDPSAYCKRFGSVCVYKHHQRHSKNCKLKKPLDEHCIAEPSEITYHYEEPSPWQTMLSRYMGYETDESSEG